MTPDDLCPLIHEAHAALKGQVVQTPLLTLPTLNDLVGGTVYLKAENCQHTGSFKYRGAVNHMRSLAQSGQTPPIIAYSSGNHAQGVAKAARDAGLSVQIVMPADAPKVKIERTKALGAEVILYDRVHESREEVAANLPEANRAYLIPPYSHPLTIAGQASVGMEVIEQLGGSRLDQALICCGGGGLATGTTAALRTAYPDLQGYTVEPEGFDDFKRSLETGKLQENATRSGSICDAIITPSPGPLTFPLAQAMDMQGVTVRDEDALAAVAWAASNLKLILEPGGAVALAAVLGQKIDLKGKSTLAVLSGGNIDAALLSQAMEQPG